MFIKENTDFTPKYIIRSKEETRNLFNLMLLNKKSKKNTDLALNYY